MITDPPDVGDHALFVVSDGQPVDVVPFGRSWTGTMIMPAIFIDRGCLEAAS